jgi:hypothetical protein
VPAVLLRPARIPKIRLVQKNAIAQKAVARVRALAALRGLAKPPKPPPPHAKAAPFGALKQNQTNNGQRKKQVNNKNDFHGRPL